MDESEVLSSLDTIEGEVARLRALLGAEKEEPGDAAPWGLDLFEILPRLPEEQRDPKLLDYAGYLKGRAPTLYRKWYLRAPHEYKAVLGEQPELAP